jgi:hypothetical protein
MRTVPVNQSAGPLLEGKEPFLLISIFQFLSLFVCLVRLAGFKDMRVPLFVEKLNKK